MTDTLPNKLTEPSEVTVIVVSARGLQGKKPGRHKYSVIFGVGSKKYRTATVKEFNGNPEWNEESTIQISNSLDQVFFIVTEKEDVLGQISIPVTTLQGGPGKTVKSQLQPHKKCATPKGELIYQCYISSRKLVNQPVIKDGMNKNQANIGIFAKRFSIVPSPVINLRHRKDGKHGTGSKLANINRKFSKSIQDIFSFGKTHNDEENEKNSSQNNGLNYMSIGTGLDSAGKSPVITKVMPLEGLIEGGTRLTIEGQYLGLNKSDVVDVTVCECDCVDTVEFESSNRIYVTTKPSLAGTGDVVIETASGGIGCLRNTFTYCEDLPPPTPLSTNPFDEEEENENNSRKTRFSMGEEELPNLSKKFTKSVTLPRAESTENIGSNSKKKHFMKHKRRASEGVFLAETPPSPEPKPSLEYMKCEMEKLRLENMALKQENKDMKGYIDRLVAKVLLHCPDALESDKYFNKTG